MRQHEGALEIPGDGAAGWVVICSDSGFGADGDPTPQGFGKGHNHRSKSGAVVRDSLQVMLHVWDTHDVDINMLHSQSAADGTFRFADVALQPQYPYGVMAVFDDVAYLSRVGPPVDGLDRLELDVPVYETTRDISSVQVDQMHALFNFAEDGLEMTEIYAVSNTGERTVKDAIKLDDRTLATLRFPLPANADFIYFEPDDGKRFVKYAGGFADTSPLPRVRNVVNSPSSTSCPIHRCKLSITRLPSTLRRSTSSCRRIPVSF